MTDYKKTSPEDASVDPTRCLQQVTNWNGWHFIQCSRKRTHGKYCWQHKKTEK